MIININKLKIGDILRAGLISYAVIDIDPRRIRLKINGGTSTGMWIEKRVLRTNWCEFIRLSLDERLNAIDTTTTSCSP